MNNRPIVIWGFCQADVDAPVAPASHAYIHEGYFKGFKALGRDVQWLADKPDNITLIPDDAIILCFNCRAEHLPLLPNAFYIPHNFDEKQREGIPANHIMNLQYWFPDAPGRRINSYTRMDEASRTLYMPWATDLMPHEIDDSVAIPGGTEVWWVGSVWDDKGQGNENEIMELRSALGRAGITFRVSRVAAEEHRRLIRASKIAPSIQGQWQLDKGYIPCRAMKNASYGQMVITNNRAVAEFFEWKCVFHDKIRDVIENAISTPMATRTSLTLAAKKIVRERHTFRHRAETLLEWVEELS